MTDQNPATTSPPAPTSQQQFKPPAVMAGGQVAAIVPQNLDDAFRVATAFHQSGLAPSTFKNAQAVLVAVMAGSELGFAPFQSMQAFAVINGKAAMWGDAIPALLWSNGFDITEWFDNEDTPTKAFCKITRPNGKEIERTFSLQDAKGAELIGKAGPWKQYRKRMLQMRARAFAARDGASDVLKGLPIYEEVRDTPGGGDGNGQGSGLRARLKGSTTGEGFSTAQAEHVDNGAHPADVAANAAAVEAEIEEIKEEAEERDAAAQALAEPEIEGGDPIEFPCDMCGAPAGEDCAEGCPAADDAEEPTGATQGDEEPEPETTADDDFPGDREPDAPLDNHQPKADPPADPKPSAPSSTFKARIAGCRSRLSEISIPNLTKLKSTWANAAQLVADLDKADPDALAELQAFYDDLLAKHEDAAREAGKAQ